MSTNPETQFGLPPLPEPIHTYEAHGGERIPAFSANQMREYARAALLAADKAAWCGEGCACVNQCGDTYDYQGRQRPPSKPQDQRRCHAEGERCFGCPHYHGKAPVCSYALPEPQAEPCPESHGECKNRHQCWEPCGELGNSDKHVKVYEPQAQAGEPEVVGFRSWSDDLGYGFYEANRKRDADLNSAVDFEPEPLITMQSHRDAIAKKDATEQQLRKALDVEKRSRAMFVARLENTRISTYRGQDVLALLDDCDMLAAAPKPQEPSA